MLAVYKHSSQKIKTRYYSNFEGEHLLSTARFVAIRVYMYYLFGEIEPTFGIIKAERKSLTGQYHLSKLIPKHYLIVSITGIFF